jgi:hypothetical protein
MKKAARRLRDAFGVELTSNETLDEIINHRELAEVA